MERTLCSPGFSSCRHLDIPLNSNCRAVGRRFYTSLVSLRPRQRSRETTNTFRYWPSFRRPATQQPSPRDFRSFEVTTPSASALLVTDTFSDGGIPDWGQSQFLNTLRLEKWTLTPIIPITDAASTCVLAVRRRVGLADVV